MGRKERFYYVTSGSNVMRDVHWCVTVFYQQIENSNIANQIHGFTIDYGKFILNKNILQYRDLLIVLPMREPSIFLGIAVSLLRAVIGSNVEMDVVALNWVADVRKQIAAAFKWLYKYFTSSSTVFIENSTFTVIIKLLHHWETPVQMVCLYNTSNLTSKSLIYFLNRK